MPGYSESCVSGAHEVCGNRDCRCQCHPWSQNLVAQKARELSRQAPAIVRESAPIEVQNTCPKCGSSQRATDVFCRADGERLVLGKQCMGCGAPGNSGDKFCWQCGLAHGTKPPEPAEAPPAEDPLTRLQRQAREQGLLKETAV